MRLPKFLSIVISMTILSLLYVHQQTEIFRFAYLGEKKMSVFQDLLDKNTVLRYNIGSSASLTRLGSKISDAKDFQMPDTYRLVKVVRPREVRLTDAVANKENIVSRIFSVKRQAEAKTINP